jgi:hypothetical protein
MASSTNETRIPVAEIDRILEDSVSRADAQRATRLDQLAQLRSAKAVQFQRERVRFAAVAEKNDPFFAALDVREQANQGLLQDLALAANQARTPVPPIDANTWIVHGRVFTSALQPAPKLVVGVADEKGNPTADGTQATTDATGYFLLKVGGLKPTGRIVTAPADAATNAPAPPVFLQVLDSAKTKKPLLTDSEPLTPRPGRTDYRELVLPQ